MGSHVADALLAAGFRVRALVRRPDDVGVAEGHRRRPREGRRPRRGDAAGARRGRGRRRPRGGEDLGAERGRVHGRERGGHGERRRRGARARPGRARRPRVVAGGGRAERGRAAREGRPTRRVPSPRTAGPSSRARRPCGARASRSRSCGRAPSTARGRRRSATSSSRRRGASCRCSPAAGRASRWSTGRTWPRRSRGALDRGARGETFYVAHPEVLDYAAIAETLAGLPSRRPFRLPVPAAADPWRRSHRRERSRRSERARPSSTRRRRTRCCRTPGSATSADAQVALGQPFRTDFADRRAAHVGLVSRAGLDRGQGW